MHSQLNQRLAAERIAGYLQDADRARIAARRPRRPRAVLFRRLVGARRSQVQTPVSATLPATTGGSTTRAPSISASSGR
jgi:hypothetical protein